MFVLTSPSFDFKADRLPSNVHYVGAQIEDPSWVEPWQAPWSSSDCRPLVLVGLSSTFQNQLAVLRNVVAAFDGLDVRALVTVGPAIDPTIFSHAPANVVVVRSANADPQCDTRRSRRPVPQSRRETRRRLAQESKTFDIVRDIDTIAARKD